MSGRGAKDPNVLAEQIDKENRQRLNWFEKNYENSYRYRPAEEIPKKAKVLHEELVRRRLQLEGSKESHAIQQPKEPTLPKANLDIVVKTPMRPVLPEEIALLGDGSVEYLKQRYTHSPSDRYYFTDTTNWMYGWKAEKRTVGIAESKLHGRKDIIRQTFPRKNGVHPELPYYRVATNHSFDIPFL